MIFHFKIQKYKKIQIFFFQPNGAQNSHQLMQMVGGGGGAVGDEGQNLGQAQAHVFQQVIGPDGQMQLLPVNFFQIFKFLSPVNFFQISKFIFFFLIDGQKLVKNIAKFAKIGKWSIIKCNFFSYCKCNQI